MSAYVHDTYVGEDGFTRCRDCRATAYNPGILLSIPCTRKHTPYKPLFYDPKKNEIHCGVEPLLPQIGTLWIDGNHNIWVWGETIEGGQAWVNIVTGTELNSFELRLPVTERHPAVHEIGTMREASDELLLLMDADAVDAIIVMDLLQAAYARVKEAQNEIIVTMPVLRTHKNPTYNETQFAITINTRTLPISLEGKIDLSKRPRPITTIEGLRRLSI